MFVVEYSMTSITAHQNHLSSAESRRQLEESTARALDRYRSEFEALRANTARLRSEREAREAESPLKLPKGRKAIKQI